MSCNCNEPKKYEISLGCCVPVIADARQYYTKSQVDKLIENIDVSGVTEEEVDEKIASAKTEIEQEIPSLSGYATEEYVSSYTYDKQTIDEKVAGGGTFDPTQYYNKTATDALLAEKVSESDFQTYSGTVASELSGKASQSLVDTLSGVVTSHTNNSDIHVTTSEKTTWNNKANVWVGTEAEWQNISGNTQTGTIYLVY